MQAKDLPDAAVLAVVAYLEREHNLPANLWRVQEAFPDAPPKVVIAKLRSLIRRKLIDGCDCGCRGDFRVLPAGRELPAAAKTSS